MNEHDGLDSSRELERLRSRVRDLESGLAEEQEQLYRLLFDLSPIGLAIVSTNGHWLAVNDRLCAMLGYTRNELADMTWSDLTPPEELDDEMTAYRRVLAEPEPVSRHTVEKHYLRKDGRTIDAEVTATVIRDAEGEPKLLLAIIEDITERKLAEQELARSEARYRLLAETAQDVILVHDMDGRIVYLNPAGLRLGGYSPEEALSRSVSEIIAPEWRGAEVERMRRRHAGDRGVFRFETLAVASDGRRVPLEVSSTAIVEEERITQVLAVARDITERKRSEAALRESEQRFREMLETVQLAAVMLDLGGRITFCNDHLAELSGWSRLELLGQEWFETLIPESIRDQERAAYRTTIDDGDLQAHFERPLLTREGEIRQVVWDATLLRDEGGRIVGVAHLGRDVTEIRRLEEQYRQAQKMEAIGQLAGGVAHDFNNLLQVILGFVDLANYSMARGRLPHTELDQVAQAASRATALVRQLLTFSRSEQLRREKLDLDQVIANLTKMLRRVLGEHIELLATSRGSLPPLWADPGAVEQVLMNLCVNARDAMPGGGTIRVATSAVTLDAEALVSYPWAQEGEYVLLSVADSGTGMTAEVLEHLFEPFFTTKAVGKGTGLGLATVYGIVRQHGGLIEVSSAAGHGTEFRIYFPAAADVDSAPEAGPTDAVPLAGAGETVLVAEDDDQVRSLAVTVLKQAGYRVLEARDGEEALRLADREGRGIDLFILDVVMPRKSGHLVLEAIRADRPSARALFCSGYSPTELAPNEPPDTGVDMLQKPFSGNDLLRKVRELLER